MQRRHGALAFLAAAIFAQSALAQGILVPHDHPHRFHLPRPTPRPIHPDTQYHVQQLHIDASIRDQVAQARVAQTFVNTGRNTIQAVFVFPLPADGAIESMTFMVDGKELSGKILPADEAKRIYESYVRKFQDPALLQWLGHGMFQTSVFPIPPGAKREVIISYSQLLKRNDRAVDFLFPLATARYTAKPVEKLSVRIAVESKEPLKNIYSPSHVVQIQRDDDHHAIARFEATNTIPGDDFRLIYDSAEGQIGANLISYWPHGEDQGYFVLLASPQYAGQDEKVLKKTVLFVVDRSGSMSGEKIDQAREAAKFVIRNLRSEDVFNIIAYDDSVETFRPELQRLSNESRDAALGFVNSINSGGGTNIDQALQTALTQMHSGADTPYVVFLTDGLPTTGQTDEKEIVQNSKLANKSGARLICFGVGFDVNSRLLDRLARAHRGQSEYVRPNQNIEEAVARLFRKITAPVLTDVRIDYQIPGAIVADGEPINRVYPADTIDLFSGEQLVLVGRYRKSGPGKIVLNGKVGDQERRFEFDVQFAAAGETPQNRFAEKLWAVRRIGEIIDQIDLNGMNQELVQELTHLSERYGILTPYTAFLADETDNPIPMNTGQRVETATENLYSLGDVSGGSGFGQRLAKGAYRSAQNAADFEMRAEAGEFDADEFGGAGFGGGGLPAGKSSGLRKEREKALYSRGKIMFAANAADVDVEKQKDEIVEIERFSDEYFELARTNSAADNEWLAAQPDDQELVVRLQGKIYRIK